MTTQTNPAASVAPQTGGAEEPSLSPSQANAAVTTDGFNKEGGNAQQPGDAIAPATAGDGTEPIEGEDPQQQGQKQSGGPGSKLRSVFGRQKKGSDETEGQVKGEEESAAKQ
ncbi:hypothetical protein GQX73_g1279 [Xylaria multiplex]|uniref:Uncharacterized protein n=1 Tax=Xylaria multiplex TaxID=323545 RepID=A0A7C8IWP5_9PEZI|nr:hypothetical protein GQX73_g1279 [Xylaria multiplex]